jgi:hypothetical protein
MLKTAEEDSKEVQYKALLDKHGICTKCGELFAHDYDAPFASCACCTAEWHEFTPAMLALRPFLGVMHTSIGLAPPFYAADDFSGELCVLHAQHLSAITKLEDAVRAANTDCCEAQAGEMAANHTIDKLRELLPKAVMSIQSFWPHDPLLKDIQAALAAPVSVPAAKAGVASV